MPMCRHLDLFIIKKTLKSNANGIVLVNEYVTNRSFELSLLTLVIARTNIVGIVYQTKLIECPLRTLKDFKK